MSRRTRKTAKKIPFSALDKLIYFFLWIIGIGIICSVIIIFGNVIPNRIAFSDPYVIACDNDIVMVYVTPLLIALMILVFSVLGYGMQYKIPVLGNKQYKSKSFEIVIPTYPLFSKEFSLNFSDKTKKIIKRFFLIMLILVVISVVILPFGINKRLTLYADDTVKIYDSFNRCEIYNWSEAEKVRVGIDKSRKGAHYILSFRFEFDNNQYEFGPGSFSGMDRYEGLEHLLYLKENSNDFTVENIRRIDRLIYDNDHTPAEQQLIYELFDYTP